MGYRVAIVHLDGGAAFSLRLYGENLAPTPYYRRRTDGKQPITLREWPHDYYRHVPDWIRRVMIRINHGNVNTEAEAWAILREEQELKRHRRRNREWDREHQLR